MPCAASKEAVRAAPKGMPGPGGGAISTARLSSNLSWDARIDFFLLRNFGVLIG